MDKIITRLRLPTRHAFLIKHQMEPMKPQRCCFVGTRENCTRLEKFLFVCIQWRTTVNGRLKHMSGCCRVKICHLCHRKPGSDLSREHCSVLLGPNWHTNDLPRTKPQEENKGPQMSFDTRRRISWERTVSWVVRGGILAILSFANFIDAETTNTTIQKYYGTRGRLLPILQCPVHLGCSIGSHGALRWPSVPSGLYSWIAPDPLQPWPE